MNNFELHYITFEKNTQRHQLSNTFKFTIEEVFENPETVNIDISTNQSMIDPIVKRNLVIPFIIKMYQTNFSIYIKLQVNSINPDPFRYHETIIFHT